MKILTTLKANLRAWAERREAAIAAEEIRLTETRIEQLRQQQTDITAHMAHLIEQQSRQRLTLYAQNACKRTGGTQMRGNSPCQ